MVFCRLLNSSVVNVGMVCFPILEKNLRQLHLIMIREIIASNKPPHINSVQDGVVQGTKGYPLSFFAITSPIVGHIRQNFLLFSFNAFAILP